MKKIEIINCPDYRLLLTDNRHGFYWECDLGASARLVLHVR
jgi:hypothetical protein